MSRIALNWMHADFNKAHEVSLHLPNRLCHQLWEEIQTIKVMRFASNSTPQGDININPYPNLKNNKPILNANPDSCKQVAFA